MITNYKKAKDDVLRTYSDFLILINEIKQDKQTSYDHSLETLSKQAMNIKRDKFVLMVVGEAKSGKSTFINAYLGEKILPMDVKQCTSAIIEIRYGSKFKLKATYGDERTEEIEDEQNIKDFLNINAALDDNYRDIPASIINIEILMVYKNKKISDQVINDLLNSIEAENLYHLSKKDYEAKVRKYIKEKQLVWQNIVKKIEIEYPFTDQDLKGIEIVDTPGVNAEGRVGEITNKYIENANAVMFLKPITGAALEALSFRSFLNSKSADRNKNAMFLILTRAANETKDNISRIHEEALRQFPAINPKQIIPIDSKVEMFYNQVQNFTVEDLNSHLMELASLGKLDSFLMAPWFMAKGDRDIYLKSLKELSNFAVIEDALNLFAHKAQYLALSEFLGRIILVINNISDKLHEDIGHYKQKAEDPIELGNKMNKIKRNLEDLTRKINQTVDEVADKYSQTGGIIEKKANRVIEKYKQEVKEIDPKVSTSLDELEKISFRKINTFKQFQGELQKNVVAECDAALIALSDKSAIKYTTLKPDLTKELIEKIKTNKKDKSYEDEYYTTGSTFEETHSRSVFSQGKYYNLVKRDIDNKIEKIKDDAVSDLRAFVTNTTTAYSSELTNNAKIKREELNEIVQAKQTAEEINETIKELEALLDKLKPLNIFVESLKGGIEKNV